MTAVQTEDQLCQQLANYLKVRWPGVLYHFDFGSGTKLSMTQAVRQKRLNDRAWPDLFVAAYHGMKFKGLFLELKREGTRIFKRDGKWANDHIMEQHVVLKRLQQQGYVADFAVGFDRAVELIDAFLEAS